MYRFLPVSLFLLTISVLSCNKNYIPTHHSSDRIEISQEIGLENSVSDIIEPYEKKLSEEMNKVLAQNAEKLIKGKPESKLGNLVADIILEKTTEYYESPIDFSIVNYGGIRMPYLSAGDITVGNIFELMPFDNLLVVLDIDGKTIQEVLDIAASSGGWPISGASFKIKADKATDIQIAGKPLDVNHTYKVAISDYLADGGDKLFMLKDLRREQLAVLFRDALLEYFKEAGLDNKPIDASIENRVSYEE